MSWSSHLLWALVNSIWQSAALAALVFVALRFARGTTAAQRYLVWGSVLVAIVLLPVFDFLAPVRTVKVTAPRIEAQSVRAVAAPRSVPLERRLPEQSSLEPNAARANAAIFALAESSAAASSLVASLIGIVSALLLLRLAIGYVRLRDAKKKLVPYEHQSAVEEAIRAAAGRHVSVGLSATIGEPCAIGFARPAIALPQALVATLSDGDLTRILRHECAHVRRFDDYGHCFEQIVRAVFFFNPVVYVVTRALDIDREIACDDAVSSAESERVEFAKCLYEIARSRVQAAWVPTTGFAQNRGALIYRIARLVDRNHNASARVGVFAKAAALGVVVAALPFGFMQLAALAYTPDAPAKPAKPVAEWHPKHVSRTAMAPAAATAPRPKVIAKADPTMTPEPTSPATPTTTPDPVVTAAPVRPTPRPKIVAVATATPAARRSSEDDFLTALADAGFRNLSVDDLIRIRDSGVSTTLLRELRAEGLTMDAGELIHLANSGVTARYLAGMRDAGYGNVPLDRLIRARDSGVDPEYAASIKRAGMPSISIDDLIRLRNNGVSGDFITHLRSSGIVNDVNHLTVDQLIKLRDSGI